MPLSGPTLHAFMWQRGHFTDLGTLGGPNSYAEAINGNGQVVGQSDTDQTYMWVRGGRTYIWHVRQAFLWEHGVMTDLGTLGCIRDECPRNDFSSAREINNRGQIVGSTSNASNGTITGFRWQRGTMMALPGVWPWDSTNARAINHCGQILGTAYSATNAVLWWRGTVPQPLNCPGLGQPVDISDLGVILGYNEDPLNFNVFGPTLCANGQVITLPPVGPQSIHNAASRMNVLGAAVGSAILAEGAYHFWTVGATHAALWRPSLTHK